MTTGTPGARTQPVIAIDGPGGAGKSTVARELARRLGWRYLDSGAMYRAITIAVIDAGVGQAHRYVDDPGRQPVEIVHRLGAASCGVGSKPKLDFRHVLVDRQEAGRAKRFQGLFGAQQRLVRCDPAGRSRQPGHLADNTE